MNNVGSPLHVTDGQTSQAVLPLTVKDKEHIQVPVPATGTRQRNLILLEFTGQALQLNGDTLSLRLDADHPQCRASAGGRVACSLSWTRLDRNALTLRITPENGDVTIQLLNVRLITAKRVSELESAPLWKILMLMIFALPVVWLLQSRPVASQWFITGTGIVILLVLQPRFTAVLLVFLVVMFYVGRLLQQRKKRPFGALLALLLASLGFLILFKMGLAPWRQTSSPTSAVSASSCPSDYPTSSSA